MTTRCQVRINGGSFTASAGELLLNAALANGIELSYYCRSGQCGTCLVSVTDGKVFYKQGIVSGEVHACQCRIISDIEVNIDNVVEIFNINGSVASIKEVSPTVIQVCIEMSRPMNVLPGQYVDVQFQDFPPRSFSPSAHLDMSEHPDILCLHIHRFQTGRVSSALGSRIREGHRVRLTGPFGSAYLRAYQNSRLILVSGGTGFAPIWAIARAALLSQPNREIILVVGFRQEGFYMMPAMRWLSQQPNVTVIPVLDRESNIPVLNCASNESGNCRFGRPDQHVPPLSGTDVVHVGGSQYLVDAISHLAKEASVQCYADAFVAGTDDAMWHQRLPSWLTNATRLFGLFEQRSRLG